MRGSLERRRPRSEAPLISVFPAGPAAFHRLGFRVGEGALLVAGAGMWYTVPIPRRGEVEEKTMGEYELVAPCLFGLESYVADELRRLGFEGVAAQDGRVNFRADGAGVARANLNLRCAERVEIKLAQFQALSFDELFEGVRAIPWENYIGVKDAFPVAGHSLKSKLSSVPSCQKIVKKAIVERLREKYGVSWFEETGVPYQVNFLLMKDEVTVLLDTSGEGLHKRGYRPKANLAPLRETLAAAMVKTTRARSSVQFWDPFAGSGTIAIEAAMAIADIAPGLRRRFSAERFPFLPEGAFARAREEALSRVRPDKFRVAATDIDPAMKALGEENARRAGVSQYIKFGTLPVEKLHTATEGGVICCNPPYGERLLERQEAEALYRVMGRVFQALPGWKYYIITSHEEFEKFFGRRADKKRKLYNGMIKCDLYQYFK